MSAIQNGEIQQALAADGAISCFSSNHFPFSLNGDRAPQLKHSVRHLLLIDGNRLLTNFSPAPFLYTFVVITQFAYGAYVGAQLQFPEGVTLISAFGILWAVGWWLRTDSRRRGVLSVYDLGFFLYLAWPLIMPYYLVKTRGAKGLLVILGFVVAYVGAAIAGIALSVFVVTMRS